MFGGLGDFEGLWELTRRIEQAGAPNAELRGSAILRPNETGMSYSEAGLLRVGGQAPVNAERRYIWRSLPGGVIEVLFEDGRPFHFIDPEDPQDRHWCDPDLYEVRYDFRRWPDWSSTWEVRGPRKNYRMVSQYRRVTSHRSKTAPPSHYVATRLN
ncbi:DUF6314 family protein [Roseovarius aestuariivivens]|uniref:DUF6314 family protein n=1 Tax=Roseovarius aestuariivivens TaxID=1888910 RepID=UPI001AEBCEFF|nr:DUF6314 family protein [Roseovarius aestuariivivens]